MGDVMKLPSRPSPPMGNEPITRETFFARGLEMIVSMYPESAPTIARGSPECEAWAKYFAGYLGWEPWGLRAVLSGEIHQMTVPAQWPEWFDTDYAKRGA